MKKYTQYLIIAACSVFYFVIISNFGLGVTPDSVNYIQIAQSISDGNGLTINNELITHWPPGYPLLLSFTSEILGLNILDAGKFLNLILFILYGWTFKSILDEFKFSSPLKHTLLITLLIGLPSTVSVFAWSELPFFVFINGALLYFVKSLKRPDNKLLIFAGVFSFCALMTRYAAAGFIIGFVAWYLLLFLRGDRSQFKRLFLYLLPIAFGLILWNLWTSAHGADHSNRALTVHIVPYYKIWLSIKEVTYWFANNLIAKVIFVCLLISTVFLSYMGRIDILPRLKSKVNNILLIGLLMLTYYTGILISISFFDAYTPLDERILSPLFPFLIIIIGLVLNEVLEGKTRPTLYIICTLLSLSCFVSSKNTWKDHYQKGSIYTGELFNGYKAIIKDQVMNFKGNTYSNGAEFLQFVTGNNNVKSLPEKISPYSLLSREDFSINFEQVKKEIQEEKAQIIYFNIIDRCWFQVCKDQLIQEVNMQDTLSVNDILMIQ